MRKRLGLAILLAGTMALTACMATPKNGTQANAPSTSQAVVQSQMTGIAPPLGLQWGESVESCGAKFGNDWTLKEDEVPVAAQVTYILNQKQTLFGHEGTVRLNFLDKSNAVREPYSIQALPDCSLESVYIEFDCPVEEIKAELQKQYGEPIGESQNDWGLGVATNTGFSTPDVKVKNITNENQKKAYHMYRYIIDQAYRDTEGYLQTPVEQLQKHEELYYTNPDALWEQIKDWDFNDGERHVNSVTLMNNVEFPGACVVSYSIGGLLSILSVN